MLHSINRIQIATPNADKTAAPWRHLLDAEFHAEDRLAHLGARRKTYRLGRGYVDFLEPEGNGPVEDELAQKGRPHLFAAGASTLDLSAFAAALKWNELQAVSFGDELYVHTTSKDGVKFRLVVTPHEDLPRIGLIDYMYEVTLLVEDGDHSASRLAKLFGLTPDTFSKIRSENFGYDGQLTLFREGELHRFEVIAPFDRQKTMGRFFDRHGEVFYMCFSETDAMLEIEHRANEEGAGITVERPDGRGEDQMADQMWLHPSALGGVMMGLSRPTMAWRWSGKPERVRAL